MNGNANKTLGKLAYQVIGYYCDATDRYFLGDERTSLPTPSLIDANDQRRYWESIGMKHCAVLLVPADQTIAGR